MDSVSDYHLDDSSDEEENYQEIQRDEIKKYEFKKTY